MNTNTRASGFMLFTAGLFLLPMVTFAKADSDPGFEGNSGQWIWALFSLIIVVLLAYWSTKFLAGKFKTSQTKHLKIAESLFLGPNRYLYLLPIRGKVLLIGSSEHGINILKEIDDLELYQELEKSTKLNQVLPSQGFSELLTPLMNVINPKRAVDMGSNNRKQRLQEGLEKIRSWKDQGRGH